jgi:hypothetical protein
VMPVGGGMVIAVVSLGLAMAMVGASSSGCGGGTMHALQRFCRVGGDELVAL